MLSDIIYQPKQNMLQRKSTLWGMDFKSSDYFGVNMYIVP